MMSCSRAVKKVAGISIGHQLWNILLTPCLRPSRLWTLQQMLGRVPSPQDNAYAVPLQQADKVPISTHLQSLNRLSQLAQHLNAFRSLFLVEQHALLQCGCQLLCACIGLNCHLPERSLQGGPYFHLHIQVCLPLTSGTVSSTAAECPLSRLVKLTLWSLRRRRVLVMFLSLWMQHILSLMPLLRVIASAGQLKPHAHLLQAHACHHP